MEQYSLRVLGHDDCLLLIEHGERQIVENRDGKDNPYMVMAPGEFQALKEKIQSSIQIPVTTPGWMRIWGLYWEDRIVGNIQLSSSTDPSQSHRALLSIAIERNHRFLGWGKKMLEEVLKWSREETKLEWIDLGVFSDNLKAIHLYEKFHFKQICKIEDQFRFQQKSIDYILMTLYLKC